MSSSSVPPHITFYVYSTVDDVWDWLRHSHFYEAYPVQSYSSRTVYWTPQPPVRRDSSPGNLSAYVSVAVYDPETGFETKGSPGGPIAISGAQVDRWRVRAEAYEMGGGTTLPYLCRLLAMAAERWPEAGDAIAQFLRQFSKDASEVEKRVMAANPPLPSVPAGIRLPPGFKRYEEYLPAFEKDHPNHQANVFLMMRFREGAKYEEIQQVIRSSFSEHGLHVVRADDRDYTGELWTNVCLYMLGCEYGIAVFEEIDQREFNPSVSLEVGFMLAHDKRCLLLKDQRMPKMPTDLLGKLYKEFDTYNVEATIKKAIYSWANDIGISGPE
ncbi:MAG: hypothetical protein ACYC3S_11130 [Chloroflexota bacterium]